MTEAEAKDDFGPRQRKHRNRRAWNAKERKLMAGLAIPGKTGKQAAIEAGYAPSHAAVAASQALKDPDFKRELQKLYDKAGLTRDGIVKQIKEGTRAKITTYFQKDGVVTDKRVDVDFEQRGKYLDRAIKGRGDMVATPEPDGPNVAVNILLQLEQAAQERGIHLAE